MIISSLEYREAARRKLPHFLFEYLESGAFDEHTLKANIGDLEEITFRQRVLQHITSTNIEINLFGQKLTMPILLSPVGLTGMFVRRGEVQAAKAAQKKGIIYTLPTLSLCSLEEVSSQSTQPVWFQLYMLEDLGFMNDILDRAHRAGVQTLVFTVDRPTIAGRYREGRSGMYGTGAIIAQKRILQALMKPRWTFDVGIMGRPHTLGNIANYLGNNQSYVDWPGTNIKSSIGWSDLEWLRNNWNGKLIIKGIMDPEDAKDTIKFGADGIIVSNHGGRQLDSVLSTVKALPPIVEAVGNEFPLLVDSGVRSGFDVVRMLALGAKAVMIGRSAVYALAVGGQTGLEHLLDIFAKEIRFAMTMTGVTSIAQINKSILVEPYKHIETK